MKLLSRLLKVVIIALMITSLRAEVGDKNKISNIHFTLQEQAWIDAHSEVTVGFISELPPALIKEKDGSYRGILPEVLALLTHHTGTNFRISLAESWNEMITAGGQRQTDVLGIISPAQKFTEKFNFTHDVFQTRFHIYGTHNNKQLRHSFADLLGKRVAYIKSFRNIEYFSKQHKEIIFVPCTGRQDMMKALIDNEVDYILTDTSLEYWRQQNQIGAFQVIGSVPILDTYLVMGIRNDWPLLRSIINKVLLATTKERGDIVTFWQGVEFNTDKTNYVNTSLLNQQEQQWVKDNPVIRFTIDPFWAPVEFIGSDGSPYGMSLQYLEQLEKILGLKFEFVESKTWLEALDKLEQEKVDVLPAISASLSKKLLFNFTPSYLSTENAIFSATDSAYIGGLDKLKNERVIVVQGYAIEEWLRINYPQLDIVTVPNIKMALKKIVRGEAYAFVGNLITTSYYIGQSGLTQIRVAGETTYTNDLGMAVRKDWALLASILHKGLNAIHPRQKTAIYNDWISIKYKHSVDYSLLWLVLSVATFIFLGFIFWNRYLTQEIIYRRQMEADLYSAKAEAEQATQAKSEFLANMSHEIRTPMNSVMGMGHLLRKTELTPQQSAYIDKMQSSSKALLTLIDGILDFSKGEVGKLSLDSTPFSLLETLKKVTNELEIQAVKKSLKLHLHIDKNVSDHLNGDPQKIAQILRNFGTNAIKFTKAGEVIISVEQLNVRDKKVHLRFTVKDTGYGISAKQKKSLFKPFSQGDNSITRRYGGTGLGLVINQQLADLMGGKISFDSTPDKGSSFYFNVHLKVCNTPIPEDTNYQLSLEPELSNINILLVDDDELNCLIAKEFLVILGANVIIAENGQIALDTLQKEVIDIVLLDIQMPVLDGYQTIKKIRMNRKWKQLPVVALSAHALGAERDKCLLAGMNDYLSKPVDPEKLRNMLLKWRVNS